MKKKYIKKTFEPYLYISSTLKPAYKNNKLWPIRADRNYQIKSSYRNQHLQIYLNFTSSIDCQNKKKEPVEESWGWPFLPFNKFGESSKIRN